MMKRLYIAYGSNMDEAQMAHRCPTAILLGETELKDYKLSFKGEELTAYATIEEAKGHKIPVLIWEIRPDDEESLDRYEEYPTLYFKKMLKVELKGQDLDAMVYIMDESMDFNLPSHEYYRVIEKAYEIFNFDKTILEKARAVAMDNISRRDK